jgi:hypothetical protein
VRAGFRLRGVRQDDVARQGFGGVVVFSGGVGPQIDDRGAIVLDGAGQPVLVPITSLERYRRTLLFQEQGLSPTQIRLRGGGATQLQVTGGNPEARVSQWDIAPFAQDDWHVRPDLILSLGLRAEKQDNIAGGWDLAPRLGFSWSVGKKDAQGRAKTVVRGGAGVFYDRFTEDLVLRSIKFDGAHTQQYLVTDPLILNRLTFGEDQSVAGVPSAAVLAAFSVPQATWRVAPDLNVPYNTQASLGLERQLPGNFTLSATLLATWDGCPVAQRSPPPPTAWSRPAAAGNATQMEATDARNQYQAILASKTLSRRLTCSPEGSSRRRTATPTASGRSSPTRTTRGRIQPCRLKAGALRAQHVAGPAPQSPFIIASSGIPNITVGAT